MLNKHLLNECTLGSSRRENLPLLNKDAEPSVLSDGGNTQRCPREEITWPTFPKPQFYSAGFWFFHLNPCLSYGEWMMDDTVLRCVSHLPVHFTRSQPRGRNFRKKRKHLPLQESLWTWWNTEYKPKWKNTYLFRGVVKLRVGIKCRSSLPIFTWTYSLIRWMAAVPISVVWV